jgi:hypothetical protein
MSNKKYELSVKLRKLIGFNQVEYFPDDAKRLITDWMLLDELLNSTQEELPFFDYSFALAPLYKAVESILFKVSKDLGLAKDTGQLGSFFSDDNIDEHFPKIVSKVANKERKKILKNELSELKTFLVRYRHIPAHAGSRFEGIEQERMAASSALHNIKCVITDLLDLKLIKLPATNLDPQMEMTGEVEDVVIPF